MLNQAGIEPKSVPLRVLVPLLEGASLEDDDDLSTKWAALLANAATPEYNVNLIPSFSNILSQLSPRDAKVLDLLSKEKWYHQSKPENIYLFAFRPTIQQAANSSDEEFNSSIDNLMRLGLCVTSTSGLPITVQQDLHKLHDLDHELIRYEGMY
jgi:hypothetical protein